MNFDYQAFQAQIRDDNADYLDRFPYPYAYFDNLFDEALLDKVNREVEEANYAEDVRAIDGEEVKTRSDFEDNEALPPATRTVFEIINGGRFLNMVTELTQIKGLISDPYFDGGGVNVIKNQGTLAVHIDGTTQHRMQICRRINAILFLNDDWDPQWNGYHEQWDYTDKDKSPFDDTQGWRCVRKILPKRNRLLVFTTNDHSWHGHAGVLEVPETIMRKSLITYYYTSSRPSTDILYEEPHRALFINNRITLSPEAYESTEVIL
ncbi:MAG: 2OG-Fe(II) oxygenase [Candidatus Puniceispirillaceae bacterium]